jgi:hypothetical protein
MSQACAQGRPDRTRITVVPICGDAIGGDDIMADTKNAFAAAMSRCSLNMTSTAMKPSMAE